jgi:methionyl-tRNA synthetase
MRPASERGFWARNALQMTLAWMRDGLRERCITRDLKWGIPVPLDGYRDKVFYVWFDAPIGYISITAQLTEKWRSWWQDGDVKLYQFIGKDNVPFHTVIFPSTLLGTGEPWTMLHHMSSTEFLNYEGDKFSKSRGVGVFGTDARETGIPADIWRFYIYSNRPEKSDFDFTWKDFQEKVNAELIGNLGNLVNRTLTFVNRFYGGALPEGGSDPAFWDEVRSAEKGIEGDMERVDLRDAFRRIFALSSIGNKRFQDGQPWKGVKENPEATATLIRDLTYLVRDLAVLVAPYLPATSRRIAAQLGLAAPSWADLGKPEGLGTMGKPEILFARIEDAEVEKLRPRFSGPQKEREKVDVAARFREKVDLRAAKILEVKPHPDAKKLYVETVDLGGEQRQIVSGLVPYYKPEELAGRNVILVANLKPAMLRGVESKGMLLAASEGKTVEVLFVDPARPGDAVELAPGAVAAATPGAAKPEIDIDTFLSLPIRVSEQAVNVEGVPLICAGKPVTTAIVKTGEVH